MIIKMMMIGWRCVSDDDDDYDDDEHDDDDDDDGVELRVRA